MRWKRYHYQSFAGSERGDDRMLRSSSSFQVWFFVPKGPIIFLPWLSLHTVLSKQASEYFDAGLCWWEVKVVKLSSAGKSWQQHSCKKTLGWGKIFNDQRKELVRIWIQKLIFFLQNTSSILNCLHTQNSLLITHLMGSNKNMDILMV